MCPGAGASISLTPGMPVIMPVEPLGHLLALRDAVGQLAKLRQRDGALQFGHPAVQRGEVVIRLRIAIAPCLVDEEPQAARRNGRRW